VSLPGTFLSTRAGRVFVHRGGRGAPLVLLHGWARSHYYFRPIVEALAADHELIALDLPGFGESDRPSPDIFDYSLDTYADIVDEVMSQCGVASANVLGASMGGGVALTLAARRPERVQRLVLVGAVVYPPPGLPLEAKLALTPGVGPLLFKHVYGKRDFVRECRVQSVRDGRCISDDWIDYFWSRLQRAGGMDAAYACFRVCSSLAENSGDPGRVRAPTLLVWGDEDRLVPLSQGKRLGRAVAGARLEVIPASGHMPFIERPQQFLRVVRPFLATPAEPLVETPIPQRRAHSLG
jgi:pimeloyl-ACP methyl ester carboxylesterase